MNVLNENDECKILG